MIVLGRNEYPTKGILSLTWRDHGMAFGGLHGGESRKGSRVAMGVLHWTGGEGDAKLVYDVLTDRGLGVDFCIDRTGTIYQFSDPAVFATYHAGPVNKRSWGVEIINGGSPSLAKKERQRSKQEIHGRVAEYADFFPAQVEALRALLDLVNGFFNIPMRLPKNEKGEFLQTAMKPEELATYSGVLGHFHVTTAKVDPGTEVFWQLAHEPGFEWNRVEDEPENVA